MRIVSYDARHGTMKIVPEDVDDLWVLYNVIRPGDCIYAITTRQIRREDEGSRPSEGKRLSVLLGLRTDKTSFQSENNRLRIGGVILDAPEKYSLLGNHHTINVDLNRELTLIKEEWQSYDVERVKNATRERGPAIIVVALDDDEGAIALLRQHGISVQGEVKARLPGKLETERREGAVNQYYAALLKILDQTWSQSTHVLIAVVGPGFWKEDFTRYVRNRRPEVGAKVTTVAMVSSGGTAGVEEAVRSGVLRKVAEKSRVIAETEIVDKLMASLGSGRGNVSYGLEGVTKATGLGAVEELLVADRFLREAADEARRHIEGQMREVERKGGRVTIVSAEHEAGRKLLGLGGMAAFLRFRVEQ